MGSKTSALGLLTHSTIVATDYLGAIQASGPTTKRITVAELQLSLGLQLATGLTTTGNLTAGFLTPCDTTSAGFTATLPAPAASSSGVLPVVGFYDAANLFDSKPLTLHHPSGGKINGSASDFICNGRGTAAFVFSNGTDYFLATTPSPPQVTNKSGAYTFVLADAGQSFTNSGASNTFTIDSAANVAYPFGPGGAITITNKAASALTIAVTGGATINGTNASRTLAAKATGVYATVSIWPIAADTWIMAGTYT